MKANALALSLILILVPLAGCSGTDTEVTVDMDSEDLQAIIDDNRDDFLNNTTVVVFQEYHNNTTVVNQYSNNSTSNVDQSGASSSTTTYNYNGSSEESEIFVFRAEWDWSDIVGSVNLKRNNYFSVEYNYYDYATNNDRTDIFTLPCSNYYDAPVQGSNSSSENTSNYWQDNADYYDWWDYLYNNTIRDLLSDVASWEEVTSVCREENSGDKLVDSSDYNLGGGIYDYSSAFVFHEMTIPNGSALKIIQISTMHSYSTQHSWGPEQRVEILLWTTGENYPYGCNDLSFRHESDDCGDYYGGWEDLHLIFKQVDSVYHDSNIVFTMYYELVPVANAS